jgi:hypothetical protein
MIDAGCYSIVGRCDGEFCPPRDPKRFEFTGETRAQCIKAARAAGWYASDTKTVCPNCMRKARSKFLGKF